MRDWKAIDKKLIKLNDKYSNRQLSEKFGIAFSTIVWRRRLLGLLKMQLQRWTPVQVEWLKRLYKHVGDYEISLMFQEAYPKDKGWTLKHIEKKRNQLGLHRTKTELKAIRERNKAFGCWMVGSVHTWQTRGIAKPGEVRSWKGREYIKTEKGFELANRLIWEKQYGKIPEGMNIVRKDISKPMTDIHNLEMITDGELGQRNKLTQYPYDLRQTIITLNKLKKEIYERHN